MPKSKLGNGAITTSVSTVVRPVCWIKKSNAGDLSLLPDSSVMWFAVSVVRL